MKNDIHPLYTLLRDPKPIVTNGNAKKHTASLRKKILLGSLIAVALGVGIWQLSEYQQREQFITWVAKYRPGWSPSTIKAQWDKIQYAKQHAEIVAPATPTHIPTAAATPTPEPIAPPPGRATAFGLTPDEYKREYPEVRPAEPVETLSDINRRLGKRGELANSSKFASDPARETNENRNNYAARALEVAARAARRYR